MHKRAVHKRAVAAGHQVPIPISAEGDELNRVEIIGTARQVAQIFVTLIVTKFLERRGLGEVSNLRTN
jgi:hypothetical protein